MNEQGDGRELLRVRDLCVEYPGLRRRSARRVLHDVSLEIGRGETLGLVGESGSGKSTLGRAVLGLIPVASGSVEVGGRSPSHATARQRREQARMSQAVFQDPYSSLNPMKRVRQTLAEPLRVTGLATSAAREAIDLALTSVGLPPDAGDRYPSQFSGGQRQRIAVARALVLRPALIVCDEPTSALDLSTQATILDLLVDLQVDTGVSYLFISHDLDVVRYVSHRVAVMREGRILESGASTEVLSAPAHPYTRRLLLSSPVTDPRKQRERREQLEAQEAEHPGV